jgi:hypothetical protein
MAKAMKCQMAMSFDEESKYKIKDSFMLLNNFAKVLVQSKT